MEKVLFLALRGGMPLDDESGSVIRVKIQVVHGPALRVSVIGTGLKQLSGLARSQSYVELIQRQGESVARRLDKSFFARPAPEKRKMSLSGWKRA